MLEGITILSKNPIMESPNWLYDVWGIFIIMFIVGALISALDGNTFSLIMGIIGILGFLIISVLGCTEVFQHPTGRYKYEVLIDESIPFQYIYDKYEIIDTKGKLYIIQDKDGE